ncbi:MAG: CPBP family intramembrane metalloprotease, partial [Clostridia bacterium]|nr:CPBP family intramembrane metalloprotease [Clostridia bacterium]
MTDNPMVIEARAATRKPRGFVIFLLLFFLVRTLCNAVASVPILMYTYYRLFRILGLEFFLGAAMENMEEQLERMTEATEAVMAEEGYFLVSLFSQLAVILLVVLYCRFVERRSLSSMGLALSGRGVLGYAKGILCGGLLASLSVLILYVTGAITLTAGKFTVGMLILYFFGFMIQGAAEEVLLRGYFMVSVTHLAHPGVAVVASAIFFSLMHNANPGITFLGFFNIFLFGLFLGLLTFRTGNLFMACALHGVWNFMTGNVYGLSVSGLGHGASILVGTAVPDRALTNGGAFGPEGGAVVTV